MPEMHQVRHLLRCGDYVRTEFRCTAPEGSRCRMACTRCMNDCEEQCMCAYREPPVEPLLEDQGRCHVIVWLEEDAPEECFGGVDGTEVRGPGWQEIVEEWNGDNYEWRYADG